MRRPKLITKTEVSVTYLANTILDGDAFDAAYDHACDALGVSSLSASHYHGNVSPGVVVMRCHHASQAYRLRALLPSAA